MRVCVVAIGNEVVNGSIVDTNSAYIANALFREGLKNINIIGLRDDLEELKNWFRRLGDMYDLVITTGGLGPTFDDLTIEAFSLAFFRRLKLNRSLYRKVIERANRKGVRVKLSHVKQAFMPEGAKIINNRLGSAAGILFDEGRCVFICLPGVPSEMKQMFEDEVLGYVKNRFVGLKVVNRYDLKLIGVAESDMDEFLGSVDKEDVEIVLNANEGELTVRLFSEDRKRLESFVDQIEKAFGFHLYSKTGESIDEVVDRMLNERGLKLSVVEGFSRGAIIYMMSDKDSFLEGVVSKETIDINGVGGDVVLSPVELFNNRFSLLIKIRTSIKKIETRYLGNEGFMELAVAKKSLWHLYELLRKDLIF